MRPLAYRLSPAVREFFFLSVTFLHWFGQFTFSAFFTPHLEVLGFSASIIGVIVGAYGLAQLLVRIPLGIASDLLRAYRLFIIIGMGCLAVSGFLMYIATTPFLFLVSRLFGGLASSTWVCCTVYYGELLPTGLTAQSTSRIMSLNSAGIFTASLFGAFFYDRLGIRFLFLSTALSGVLAVILMLPVKTELRPRVIESPRIGDVLRVVFHDKNLLNCALLCALAQFISYATSMSFLQNYAALLNATPIQLSLLSVLYSGFMLVGSAILSSHMRDRMHDRSAVLIGFLLSAAFCALFAVSRDVTGLFVGQAISGFSKAFITVTLMNDCIRRIPPALRASAMGIYQSIYGLGMTFGSPAMGSLLDLTGTNYVLGFWVVGVLSVIGLVWTWLSFYRPGAISWYDD